MATDGPTPPPCDQDIYKNGECIAIVSASSNRIENWVKLIRDKTNSKIDWHYCGGRGMILHLGDQESRDKVGKVIEELKDKFDGQILEIYK